MESDAKLLILAPKEYMLLVSKSGCSFVVRSEPLVSSYTVFHNAFIQLVKTAMYTWAWCEAFYRHNRP